LLIEPRRVGSIDSARRFAANPLRVPDGGRVRCRPYAGSRRPSRFSAVHSLPRAHTIRSNTLRLRPVCSCRDRGHTSRFHSCPYLGLAVESAAGI